jgi:hypothetical protein
MASHCSTSSCRDADIAVVVGIYAFDPVSLIVTDRELSYNDAIVNQIKYDPAKYSRLRRNHFVDYNKKGSLIIICEELP